MLTHPEWYLVTSCLDWLSIIGIFWRPLRIAAPILILALFLSLAHASLNAAHASFHVAPGKLMEDDWATHWVTVGAVQEKVGVSVDRSQTDSQDCGLQNGL